MLDVGEDVLIGAHDCRRLVLVCDLLAEYVDRRELPLRVDVPHGLARVFQFWPCDVALGELLHERPWDGRKHANDRAVEDRHRVAILRLLRQSSGRPQSRAKRSCAPISVRVTWARVNPAAGASPSSC